MNERRTAKNGFEAARVKASVRTEAQRQALIAEYRKLRSAGLNAARRTVILTELQAFELGWPEKPEVSP